MEKPAPDPSKLLDAWMEWERGETPPGRVISNLKTGGLRDLLEGLAASGLATVAAGAPAPVGAGDADAGPATEAWTPLV